jgi:peptidoglycan hydrolase-like protein with peptidoglycan-binding domain
VRTLRQGSSGNDVMEIQSLLGKMGYNPGPIDGVFGLRTKKAVQQFQSDNGLAADGIIGPNTHTILLSFLLGYDNYTIKPGEQFANAFRLSRRFILIGPVNFLTLAMVSKHKFEIMVSGEICHSF